MKELAKKIGVILFLLSILVVEVEAGATVKVKPLKISKVRLDNKSFDPSKNEKVELSFEISRQADVRVLIYDRLESNVKEFKKSALEPGRHNFTWNGRSSNGGLAEGSVFLYVIEATDVKNNEKVVYNPAKHTGGLSVEPLEYTFDNKTGKIEYVLPKACMVRIRAGLKSSMLANTIIDWQPRSAGRHIEIWDGKDTSGTMDMLNHPGLELNLTCYTLPDNTIIAEGKTIPLKAYHGSEHQKDKTSTDPWPKKDKYLHYQHDPLVCHEPKFTVTFPTAKQKDEDKSPVVSGKVPVRVELDQADAQYLTNKRYEIMLFVDGIFIFEMEEGTSPFTFHWDTTCFAKGSHLITVNVISYDDHIGTISHKLFIGE